MKEKLNVLNIIKPIDKNKRIFILSLKIEDLLIENAITNETNKKKPLIGNADDKKNIPMRKNLFPISTKFIFFLKFIFYNF